MRLATLMSLVLLGVLAVPIPAAPVIQVGTWYLLPGMEREFLIVVSSNADMVEGLDLAVQIGEGGPLNGGTDTWPSISQLSVVGAGLVFDQNVRDYIVGPLYDEVLDITDPLIWRARVRVERGYQTLALGTLARVTVKANGTGELERPVRLTGVAAGYDPPGLDTNFGLEPFPTVINGLVRVWQPHTLRWNSTGNGNWTDQDAWDTGSYPAHYPNCTVIAVLDSPRTVSVHGVQEAYSLSVSAGEVSLATAARLSLLSASSIGADGKISVAGELRSAGPLTNNGLLEIAAGATVSVTELIGSGTTTLAPDATLIAESIYQGTLDVGGLADSPGRVVLLSSAATGQGVGGTGSDLPPGTGMVYGEAGEVAAVPEPCTLALALTAAVGLCAAQRWRRRS